MDAKSPARLIPWRGPALAAAILAVAITGLSASPAAAAKFTEIPGFATVLTDRSGVAAWRDGDRLHVWRDDQAMPETRALSAPLAGCALEELVAGKALFDCAGANRVEPVLYDLATGASDPPPGTEELVARLDADRDTSWDVADFGEALIQVDGIASKGSIGSVFLNWRTGEVFDSSRVRASARTVPSLDSPTAQTALCAPLRRRHRFEVDEYTLERKRVFDPVVSYGHGRLLTPRTDDGRGLVLQRCGSGRARMLVRDTQGGAVTPRYAAWLREGRIYAYIFRSRRRVSWKVPFTLGTFVYLRATNRRLFAVAGDHRKAQFTTVPSR